MKARLWQICHIKSGLRPLQIQEEDRYEINFYNIIGLLEWSIIPFGLNNGMKNDPLIKKNHPVVSRKGIYIK